MDDCIRRELFSSFLLYRYAQEKSPHSVVAATHKPCFRATRAADMAQGRAGDGVLKRPLSGEALIISTAEPDVTETTLILNRPASFRGWTEEAGGGGAEQ